MTARTAWALVILGATTASEDAEPRYAVAPGTEIARVWTSTSRLESAPARVLLDGQEIPTQDQGEARLRVGDDKRFEVLDTIEAVAEGRPTRFQREYREFSNVSTETLVAKPPEGDETERTTERERTTPLDGQVVRFTWDGQDEEYDAAFVTAEGEEAPDEDLLADLWADADWLELVADGPREVGAEFALEASTFSRFMHPLGDLHWLVDGQAQDATARAINEQLLASTAGKAKATWRGVRDEDGRAVGVFEIEAELTSSAEAEVAETGEMRRVKVAASHSGEILWDIAAGRIASYATEVELETTLASRRRVTSPQGEVEIERIFDLTGTTQHKLTTRVP